MYADMSNTLAELHTVIDLVAADKFVTAKKFFFIIYIYSSL